MSGTVSSSEIGDALVFTSSNRGHSPEEIAEMALNKIMSVSETAPPVIRDQAFAHRQRLKEVLLFYMSKMCQSERTTIWALMKQQGHDDMAEIIRRL
jgi:hypothetical protein|tara:strand:+ start:2469 stop:2759 length:291 start_codon:yes stop_codon:yes gene_type:complete